ncbi:MAG TPA: class I SAM-dependent methyltransferase [Steroidobacteraceae bacterium]|nr:class I SAM-dependent methyltransferase [Steroidobacteraceae bacterium]
MTQPRDDCCPLCRIPAETVFELQCAAKPPLADSICFRWCPDCDFIFAQHLDAEAYRTFYRSALHDTAHVSDADTPDNLHRIQAELLCGYLGSDFRGNCLDFGSGEGQLLERLCRLLPNAKIYATDLRNSLRSTPTAVFLENLDSAAISFDLIVLSHVVEHFVDLSEVSKLLPHLAPGGTLYIEVPDPLGYNDCPRREFMYYFDRLHVNHFSRLALSRWLAQHSLDVTMYGTHRFAYRDGKYPAQFVFATSGGNRPGPMHSTITLREAFSSYRDSEALRAKKLRELIVERAGARDFLVYGRGDNFARARSPGGPLHQLPIKAILDRNAQFLSADGSTPVVAPSIGFAEYPDAVVLMTVSAGADIIVEDIRARAPDRTVIMI